jgi:lipopolysaccharide biosynthesis regulator YciM
MNIKELYAEGLDMLVSGKYKAAYKNFKEIVEKDSNNIKAYIRLGQVLRQGGNYLKALKIHKSLLNRKSISNYELIEIHKNLSMDYLKISDINKSIVECKSILNIENNNEWALYQLIILYKKNSDWEKATEYLKAYFEKTGKRNDNKLSLYKIQQSKLKIKDKKFDEAREILEKSLSIKPDFAAAYYFLAKSYSEESNIEYEKAISIQNENSSSLTDSNQYNSYLEEAKKILSKAIPQWVHFSEIDPEQSWLVLPLLKDALFVLNRYTELEEILVKLNNNFPENIEIMASLADYYSHKGEVEKAISLLEANTKEDNSLILDLIKIKLELQKEGNDKTVKKLDKSINNLSKDTRYQFSNNSSVSDMMWLLEDIDDNEV